uniref:BAG domain-containing protein n=1 Tax=Caenorhabditis tropicalis TaxID=1561998 RepID=A0A1I7UPA8_9PELO
MNVSFKARSLWKTGKEVTVKCTKALTSGIRFCELFAVYEIFLRPIVPASIEHPVDCILAFVLFHLYLLYILIFCFSLEILKKVKTKGSGIGPMTGCVKEKASVFLTYFLVFQSVSKMAFGGGVIDRIMGWAFQLKPQINFKPQIKIGKSKSNESVVSVKSKIGTSLHVGLESDDEDTRKTIKTIGNVKKTVDFATELVDAVVCPDVQEEDSTCLVQKWLEDRESKDSEEVKRQVMKLMAENDQMKKEAFKPP